MSEQTEADRAIINNADAAELAEQIKRDAEKSIVTAQREEKEAIANIYEAAGKIKAMHLVKTQADFLNLVMLKSVKDAKEYRTRFGMSWEKFCEHVGVSRRWVDEQLADLKPFKVEFAEAFLRFSGMPLNKIKYLAEPVSGVNSGIAIEDNAITYNGETIPLDAEHKDDIQALLETIEGQIKESTETVAAKDKVLKDKEKLINKYARDLSRLEGKLKKQELTPVEAGFIKEMDNLRTSFDGYLLMLDPDRVANLEELEGSDLTPRMRAAYLSAFDYMKKQVLMAADRGEVIFGSAVMCPEAAWHPGMDRPLMAVESTKGVEVPGSETKQ